MNRLPPRLLLRLLLRPLAASVLLVAASPPEASAGAVSREAKAALLELLPDGYETAAVLSCSLGDDDRDRFVAALVDRDAEAPEKPVRLLYLAWNGSWTLLDSLEIAGGDAELVPQYLNGIDVVTVGQGKLLFVYTNWSAGGSGSLHYYQFFTVVSGRLKLLKTFEHERMERGYLCLRNDRIYDATLVKRRGEKQGGAYLYSAYLDTTEHTFDGERIVPVRSERLEERTGNRFLDESYRNLSLRSLLRRGGHFP